jgi:uncharacterized membrane protein YqhA
MNLIIMISSINFFFLILQVPNSHGTKGTVPGD